MPNSIPEQIGRYEVVGRLALGGMAEILLGRLRGPSGFMRPAVIKCILPQHAQDPSFVSMFLDEARIAAAIRHPNVVQYQELVEEQDLLYVVLEYLEGETLGSLSRRSRAMDTTPNTALVAHIIAEVCSGLHAAHELTDAEGEPQELVHRDVTPHNIFVTYSGDVKLMDFGIAKAAGRITETEAGLLKGKFAYMSPEQIAGKTLDRRSDVFSLGVVLYEVSTQRSLFRRDSQAATLNAIMTEPIVPPTSIVEGYPASLEAVCLRALAKKRNERYATAAEMQKDLLVIERDLSPGEIPSETVSNTMSALFPDRIEVKQELLRQVCSGSSGVSIPSAEVNVADVFPEIEQPSLSSELPTKSDGRFRTGQGSLTRSARRLIISIMAIAVIASGGLGLWLARRDIQTPPQVASQQTPTSPAEPVVKASGQQTPPSPEGPPTVTIEVDSSPQEASVFVGGEKLGKTPFNLPLEKGPDPVTLVLKLDGYEDHEHEVVPTVERALLIQLDSKRTSSRRRNPPRKNTAGTSRPTSSKQPATSRDFPRFQPRD